eukprot:m.142364 g.142364  ORF g.142364 m.142364 type:complete len:262 (-) comp30247_c0_seq1:383-1168(-)
MSAPIEDEWDALIQLHLELQAKRNAVANPKISLDDNGNYDRAILLAGKARRYESEIKVLKRAPSLVLDQNLATSIAATENELESSIVSADAAIDCIHTDLKQVEAKIEREKEWFTNHTRMLEALAVKLEQGRTQNETEASQAPAITLNQKTNKVSRKNRGLQKEMGDFMTKYFPTPTEEQIAAATNNKTDKNKKPSAHQFVPFMDLLEDLMNRATFHPEDPHIQIDPSRHWEMYIEFIQRWGIGVKHPSKPDLIKLTEYHV